MCPVYIPPFFFGSSFWSSTFRVFPGAYSSSIVTDLSLFALPFCSKSLLRLLHKSVIPVSPLCTLVPGEWIPTGVIRQRKIKGRGWGIIPARATRMRAESRCWAGRGPPKMAWYSRLNMGGLFDPTRAIADSGMSCGLLTAAVSRLSRIGASGNG